MRPFVAILSACFAVLASAAPTSGPIRVLYLDPEGAEQSAVGPLHSRMAELGREAIWFDYVPGEVPPSVDFGRYDALVVPTALSGHRLPMIIVEAGTTPCAPSPAPRPTRASSSTSSSSRTPSIA
ncbi:MAG: hypothetical protein ACKOBS_01120 [Verrucomicrobiota bacterium]